MSLSWGELTLLPLLTLRGVKVLQPYSSAKFTLYLVDRATVKFGHFSFAPVSDITSNRLLFRRQSAIPGGCGSTLSHLGQDEIACKTRRSL